VDLLSRNTTWNSKRDTTMGAIFAGTWFYDGQAFVVNSKKNPKVKKLADLNKASVCVETGTTTERNLADYARANKLSFKPVVFEGQEATEKAFQAGRCDAYTTDASQLASIRATATGNPENHIILPERISKEPLGPMVRHGDDQWFDVVKWSLAAMIEAEELGVSQGTVLEMVKSSNPAIQRMLGVQAGFGKALGLEENWAYNVIKQVGNYGDSFERNLGKESRIGLDRGLNDLWFRGGLLYAIPLR
jgi:general L-amino acid transport system substrate-binding protein